MSLDLLLNRTVVSIEKNKKEKKWKDIWEDIITFNFEDGSETFIVEGDCCSRSWIEHLTIPDDVKGSKVISIENIRMGPQEEIDDNRYVKSYETRIRTNRGDIVLEYRNESNGYYGGSIEHLETK